MRRSILKQDNARLITRFDVLIFCAFFVSFLHSALALAFLAFLVFLSTRGTKNCVKALLLLTARGVISSTVAVNLGGSVLKLSVILIASFFIFINTIRESNRKFMVDSVLGSALAFAVFAVFASFLNSSYPITAAFKIISFIVPFIAILVGVNETKEYPWKEYFVLFFGILFAISLLMVPFARFRIVNYDFQGIFNHVNLFGIVGALYVAVLLYSDELKKHPLIRTVALILMLVMIYLSASRTGLFSALFAIAFYYAFGEESKKAKIVVISMTALLFLFFILAEKTTLVSNVSGLINDFIYKSNTKNILASRQETLAIAKEKYENSKLFGSGFMVPWIKNFTNYGMSFNLIVEPGNLIWAILGDTGIIGMILFALLVISIFLKGDKRNVFLLVTAFSINMGEMVFFSSNNMAILVWLLIALYLSAPQKRVKPIRMYKKG